MLQENIKTFATSQPLSSDLVHIARIVTVRTSSRTQEFPPILKKQYLRLGHLVIALQQPSTQMADLATWHRILICLLIFLRFMHTSVSKQSTFSVNARLSGLLRFWLKKYETYTTDSLLTELFSILCLQNTLLYQRTQLLRIRPCTISITLREVSILKS